MAVKKAVSKGLLHQYIAALSACFAVICAASCYGWMTTMFSYLLDPDSQFPITAEQAPWLVSIIELGSLVSTLPAGVLVNYIGRKPIILATGPIFIVSWLMILYFPKVIVFGAARVLQGFAVGLVFTAAPVYLGEIASISTRGAITSCFFNCWWLGYIIQYLFGSFLTFYSLTYFTLALNIPIIILFAWQPESPYYLLMIGKDKKARESLQWFRDVSDVELDEELFEIKENIVSNQTKSKIRDLVATPEDRKVLALLLVLTSVTVLSGVGAIDVYATQIFDLTPNLPIPPDIITVLMGVVMFLGGCISSLTSDKIGRRPLLLISSIGSVICQFCTGTYYFLLFKTEVVVSTYSWVAPMLILIYSGICTAGIYPVSSSYISELFNTQNRGFASGCSVMTITACSYIAMLTYQPITYNLNVYTNFYIYSLYTLLCTIYFYFAAPETKGKSFIQIRQDICKKQCT